MLRMARIGRRNSIQLLPPFKNCCTYVTEDISLYTAKVKQTDDEMKLKRKMFHFTVDIKKSL
jgi:hypothetical protein